jgi:hypothetical protein
MPYGFNIALRSQGILDVLKPIQSCLSRFTNCRIVERRRARAMMSTIEIKIHQGDSLVLNSFSVYTSILKEGDS